MSENIDIFKSDPKPPHGLVMKQIPTSLAAMDDSTDDREMEEFRVGNRSQPSSPKNGGNNDLIETDDELLEVGSNEEDEEDDDEDGDNSNLSRPLDFTTGRKLSDSGMKSHQTLNNHFLNLIKNKNCVQHEKLFY